MMISAGISSSTGSVRRERARSIAASGRGRGARTARPATAVEPPVLTRRAPRTPASNPSTGARSPGPRRIRTGSPLELLVHLLLERLRRALRRLLALHHLLDLAVEDVRALERAPPRRRRVYGRVVEQLLGERLLQRVLEVAGGLDPVDRARQEADRARELGQVVGAQHEVDEGV